MTAKLSRVLCIDDSEDIREVAQMCLETMSDYQVSCLSSGAEAVEQAVSLKPDIILLDVMMPQMDGPETLKALREIPELDTIPIVFMTARVQAEEIAEYMKIGASGVINKPFDPMEIANQLQVIWERFHER